MDGFASVIIRLGLEFPVSIYSKFAVSKSSTSRITLILFIKSAIKKHFYGSIDNHRDSILERWFCKTTLFLNMLKFEYSIAWAAYLF